MARPLRAASRPTACHYSISGSISLSASSSFHLSFTVLVHYRSLNIFRLGKWSPPARGRRPSEPFKQDFTCLVLLRPSSFVLRLRLCWPAKRAKARQALLDYHHLWLLFQQHLGWSFAPTTSGLSPLSLATTYGISFDFLS